MLQTLFASGRFARKLPRIAALIVFLGMLTAIPYGWAETIPMVVSGGWSNTPEDFIQTPLADALRRARNGQVFFSRHKDPWGDIDENAVFEAGQIRHWLDSLSGAAGPPAAAVPVNRIDSPKRSGEEALSVARLRVQEAGKKFERNDSLNRNDSLKRSGDEAPWVARVQTQAAGKEFDLVGFSMGGLIARSIILKHAHALGGWKVRHLILMGTPNHGANQFLTYADIGYGPLTGHSNVASQQMWFNSPFLRDLNSRQIPAHIRVTTIAGNVRAEVPVMPPQLQHPGGHPTGQKMPCTHPKFRQAGPARVPTGELEHPNLNSSQKVVYSSHKQKRDGVATVSSRGSEAFLMLEPVASSRQTSVFHYPKVIGTFSYPFGDHGQYRRATRPTHGPERNPKGRPNTRIVAWDKNLTLNHQRRIGIEGDLESDLTRRLARIVCKREPIRIDAIERFSYLGNGPELSI